jgi:hypothetical protein
MKLRLLSNYVSKTIFGKAGDIIDAADPLAANMIRAGIAQPSELPSEAKPVSIPPLPPPKGTVGFAQLGRDLRTEDKKP